jgi:3-oxoacyl-[acyl-carrier protein] reductase
VNEKPDFTGKKVVVMSAGNQPASAIALAFAQAGADVALTTTTADAEEAFSLRRLSKRITELGRRSLVESIDLALGTSVQVGLRQVSKALGGIDVLVVGTDVPQEKPTERLSDADWAKVLNYNLSAVFYACRAALREIRAESVDKGRVIVLVPSMDQSRLQAGYAAATVAASAFVQVAGREWADKNLTVNGILLVPGGDEETAVANAVSLALFLAKPEAASTTGELFTIEALK